MAGAANRSFSSYLRRFALAVDVVEEATFNEVGHLAVRYVKEGLEIDFAEVVGEHSVDGQAGLTTLWRSEPGDPWTHRLADDDDEPNSQTALAVLTGQPLWVVPADGTSPLHECKTYVDLWSGCNDLPTYRRPTDKVSPKTSVVIPLQRYGRRVGAICLESGRFIECTDVAQEELETLAEALTLLYYGKESRERGGEATRRALSELTGVLNEVSFPPLRPQLFLASAAGADENVVACIEAVVGEFGARVKLVHWDRDFTQAVFINQQLIQAITKSRFGICYLSEPVADGAGGSQRFCDNHNVIFEAGMLHALNYGQESGGWIPVREEASPLAPFDIRQLPMVLVPRDADGYLDAEGFKARLRERIAVLVGDDA